MPFTQLRTFLTAKEAAVYLGGRCNHETVHALIYKGELKAKKVGREWRIMPEWLDEYMNKPDNVQQPENKVL
jgi:excisionase family DNA binding protein